MGVVERMGGGVISLVKVKNNFAVFERFRVSVKSPRERGEVMMFDPKPQFLLRDEVLEVREHFVLLLRGTLLVPPFQPKTSHANVVEDEKGVGELEGLVGHGTIRDKSSRRSKVTSDLQSRVASRSVESELWFWEVTEQLLETRTPHV